MTKNYTAGTMGYAGSTADTEKFNYPAVPYTIDDFHTPVCQVENPSSVKQVKLI